MRENECCGTVRVKELDFVVLASKARFETINVFEKSAWTVSRERHLSSCGRGRSWRVNGTSRTHELAISYNLTLLASPSALLVNNSGTNNLCVDIEGALALARGGVTIEKLISFYVEEFGFKECH